jgi:hypothetical protein
MARRLAWLGPVLLLWQGLAFALPAVQVVAASLGANAAATGPSEKLVRVTRQRDGAELDSRRFQLLDDGNGRVLVQPLDPIDRGQQILSTDTEMWFMGSGSRRAVKIPPIQRAFGEASLGDVARLDFGRDYRIVDIAAGSGDLALAIQVRLEARSPAATYGRVLLWLRQTDLEPLQAHYFLASGKHGKTAHFLRNRRIGGVWQSDERLLTDPDADGRGTRLTIESVVPRDLPAHWFTPQHMELRR